MEPNAENPKPYFYLTKIQCFTELHEDLKPKPGFLKPWFKYFDDKFASDNLPKDKLELMRNEFAISHIIGEWINLGLNSKNKPVLAANILENQGIDPARLVRYLAFQMAYPKGIALDNERFIFDLDLKAINNLLEGIKQAIPNMNKLSKEQLLKILTNLGFEYDKEKGSYLNAVDQQGFKKMLTQIVNTHSL